MSHDPRKFKLGVFVLSGLALLIAGILTLGAGEWYRESVSVYCYFDESVSGLDRGSPVRYRGVNIGVVEEVRLVSRAEGSMRPDALIEVRSSLYPDQIGAGVSLWRLGSDTKQQLQMSVARGLRASLAVKDITLQKYIALEHYPVSEQPIRDLGITPKAPFVPTAVEATFQDIQRDLATTLAQLARVNYEEIAQQMNDLLVVTTQRIESIDTQALAGHAEETLVAVRRLAEDPALRRFIDRMDTISARAEHTMVRIDDLVSRDELDTVAENLAVTSEALASTARQLDTDVPRILDSVDQLVATSQRTVEESRVPETTESLRGAADSVGDAARNLSALREDLRRTLRDLGAASRSIGRLARTIEEHPGAILSGKPAEVE